MPGTLLPELEDEDELLELEDELLELDDEELLDVDDVELLELEEELLELDEDELLEPSPPSTSPPQAVSANISAQELA